MHPGEKAHEQQDESDGGHQLSGSTKADVMIERCETGTHEKEAETIENAGAVQAGRLDQNKHFTLRDGKGHYGIRMKG
jgi:hypothetical protein